MKVRSIANIVALFLVVGLLSACGAKGRTVVMTDEGQIVPGKTVSLRIRSGENALREDFVEVSRRFHTALSNRLLAERIFDAVVDPGEPADYEMVASMEHLVMRGYASGGKRDGVIHVRVSVIDKASGTEIKSFLAIGVGPRIAGPYGYGKTVDPTVSIYQAIEQIAVALRVPPGQAI